MSEVAMMLAHPGFDKAEEPKTDKLGLPEGMVEYQTRTAIRDLMRVYGFENGRQIVAEIVNDEAGCRRATR